MKRAGVNRRIFLRGLGGACVAAPFLSSLCDRSPRAQSASTSAPRRLIAMFTHGGCLTTRFFPTKSHGVLTADDLQPTTLKRLIPYIDKLLIPRGIRAMNEWTIDMVRGQGNDIHLQEVASYFTCQPVTPNSNNPLSFDQTTKFNAKPVGSSLDHIMAQQLSPMGVPLFMRVGNSGGSLGESPGSNISYLKPASAAPTDPADIYPGFGTPTQVFASLTGLFQSGSAPATYQAMRGKLITDLVKGDLGDLERLDMSQTDRNKLEAWKALVNQTTTIVTSQCTQDQVTALGLTQPNVDAASGSAVTGGDILTKKITDTLDGADIYSNLAVLAALCNANPVIFLKYPPNYVFTGLGINVETDSLAHRTGSGTLTGTCVPNVIEMLATIDDYYTQKFAHLVDTLNSIDEGDGKVLDHTAAVWFQAVSDGCANNLNNLPIVQAGSCGGTFKTGWTVNVDDGSPDLTKGNSELFCSPDGSNMVSAIDQATGTDPSLANAPINKYYCNLMNALGVKAGADGFPAKGGTAEVTKFGMYDKTEDFIGGGTNPPTIHDPGEFSTLRG